MSTHSPTTETPRAAAILARFLSSESAGGLVLMGAALAALIVANSPLSQSYFEALHSVWLGMSVEHWVNDGLMAIFFCWSASRSKEKYWQAGFPPGANVLYPDLAQSEA